MHQYMFKPKNYNAWTISAISKIQVTMESCETDQQLSAVKTMIDNLTMMLLLNDDYSEEYVRFVSQQLYLSLKLKQFKINASN